MDLVRYFRHEFDERYYGARSVEMLPRDLFPIFQKIRVAYELLPGDKKKDGEAILKLCEATLGYSVLSGAILLAEINGVKVATTCHFSTMLNESIPDAVVPGYVREMYNPRDALKFFGRQPTHA